MNHDIATQTTAGRRKPRRRGRPSLLTDMTMDLLTRATAVGLPMKQAADAAGISRSSFLSWMQLGEDVAEEKQGGQLDVNSPDPHAALYARITRARAAAVVRAHGHIEEAARGAIVSETIRTRTDRSPETPGPSAASAGGPATGAHPPGGSCVSIRSPRGSTSCSTRRTPGWGSARRTPWNAC